MTFGAAILEALLAVVKKNDWKVAWNFLRKFHPRTLASLLLMIVLEAVTLATIQERWTDLTAMNWWQSIGMAFAAQAGFQKLLDTLLDKRLGQIEARYQQFLIMRSYAKRGYAKRKHMN